MNATPDIASAAPAVEASRTHTPEKRAPGDVSWIGKVGSCAAVASTGSVSA